MCRKRKNKHKKGGNHVAVAGALINGSSILKPLAVILPLNDHPQQEMPSAGTSSSDSKGLKATMKTYTISSNDKNILEHDKVFETVHEFCDSHIERPEMRRPITRVLVATNGIAAVRCMLSIRRVLQHMFNNDRAVKFICITTEQEILSNAEYLKLADHYVTSPGGENRNNYANVDEIVSHAIEQKVDAVWAGWGHASENPELPRQLKKAGITFIGPPAEAMASLGDKIASTIIAQSVGIPTIEWSGSGLTLEEGDKLESGEICVSSQLFHKACVSNVYEGLDAMTKHKIGYPMMIKASEGGGGKGIRKCMNETDFKENFLQVQTEVPGSPIFLMKCLENARHIEVQLIADRYGCVIPIFTRDCSIQRRCQKIIEEAPASIASKATIKKMQEDAVRIAELVGYESAGTVEYMYLPAEDTYFFLELNPRLQVEHPCTEMLTNINIPAIQLQIAMGIPLNRITDIRLFYGLKRVGTDPLPDDRVLTDTEYSVIAARITSEDPDDFFRPSTGQVIDLNFRSAQNVWGYFSVSSSGKVHEFADSQFGHLFARGRTRHEAISTMLCALQELELRATFTSQVMYLVDLLNEEDFKQNKFNTQWLDRRIADKVRQRIPIPDHELIALSSAVIGQNRVASAFNNFRNAIERGQVLPTKDLTETFLFDLIKDMKIYKVQVTRSGPLTFIIYLNGATTTVEIRQLGDNSLLVTHKEKSYTCHLEETSDKFKVTIGRSIVAFEKDNDPTILKSPYTGRLLSYKKKDKDLVGVGQVYASVESMKLVFNVEVKKVPGKLEHIAKEGDLLYPGSVIARIIEQKSTEDYRPKPFTDIFNEWTELRQDNSNQSEIKRFQAAYDRCINLLNGSVPPGMENQTGVLVDELFELFECPTLPHAMLKKSVDTMVSRLPEKTAIALRKEIKGDSFAKFKAVRDLLDKYMGELRASEYEAARAICKSVYDVCEKFYGGPVSHMVQVVNALLDEYFNCEEFFETDQYTDAVDQLNAKHGSDKDKVVALIYSHTQLKAKNKFMLSLLDAVQKKGMHLVAPLEKRLRDIGNLFKTESVSKRCRHLMLLNSTVKYRKFVNKVLWDLDCVSLIDRESIEVLSVGDAIAKLKKKFGEKLQEKKDISPQKIFDCSPWSHKVIHEFFFDPLLAEAAIRAYIGQHFAIEKMQRSTLASNDATVYDFCLDNSNLMHYMSSENNQYLSIVKFSVNYMDFHEAVTHKDIISGLVSKFKSMGVKSNGRKSTLRVTFLVDVIDFQEEERRAEEELTRLSRQSSSHREALLEELPIHSQRDEQLVDSAEKAAKEIRLLISTHLDSVDVVTHVLVCNKNKPLMQVDLLGAEKLELWRLPAAAKLKSDKLSSLHVYRTDDTSDKRFSRIYVREIVEVAIRPETKEYLDEIRKDIINQMDRACGAINVTMSRKVEKTKNRRASIWCTESEKDLPQAVFVGNHLLFSVTFPKMPSSFTKDNEHDLDDILIESIEEMRPILFKHHVTEVEIVYSKIDTSRTSAMKRRVKYQDKTGVTPEFGIYDEYQKEIKPVALSHQLYERQLEEHHPIKKIEKKRSVTRGIRTSYVYDYPMLFGKACLQRWKELEESNETLFTTQFKKMRDDQKEAFEKSDYRKFFHEAELVFVPGKAELRLVEDEKELKTRADNCNNETGVVAWKMTLYTPEKPRGYTVIVIANDITFQSGSFATSEDDVYSMASEYSRKHKLPRVNVSSNSGARIGLAEDVSKVFRVKFRDQSKPEDGFEHLFLESKDAEPILDQIDAEKLPNQTYKLNAVIGRKTEMIGVENLQGSGLIAGETSAAYDEVPTYCFVTGRSVGIGAYTARLAHRIVQAKSSHIILTGTGALNAVLGKEVYTSNNQLGGTQIMYNNGVTHAVCDNDFEGVSILVLWMSYLPDVKPEFPYLSPFGVDSEPRPVSYPVIANRAYDVRDLIDSKNSEFDGICDNNSFNEIMNDWAKTIIAGRARLCGVPIGVVSSELRNVCSTLPADPATPNSQAIEVHQAGQVWYPDSAFKTAEVIGDFNREGLPLLFIASLRGFSGGQKDMFDMVLKFGAQIVDALRQYKQPVLIYIPTHGELRGGAWAVLDSKINPGFITMIADSESRGGILEPSAIVGIKFRADKLLALQKRNDEIMAGLDEDLKKEEAKKKPEEFLITPEDQRKDEERKRNVVRLQTLIAKRSEELKKPYRGITVEFADLHDRPERMKNRKAVQHVVELRNSRNLFYDIIRVEMVKVQIAKRFLAVAERDSNWQIAMSWVNARLQEFKPCETPREQFDVLETAVTSHEVDKWLRLVREQSVDRDLEEMGEDELRLLKAKLEAIASKRKFSL
ncbi:hypothetical protein PFISCL1PPCAC_27510 [Pristionchus fissidentatus]|uniref:Acetyl-CoA carboxylase n=1 Tax=Pristionchus fissidentatus TaxID=1538716 RepID=A0AAV5WY10_9BILA|nr:hypothetical protein PFISCL1PPCAC_27510 [Pristionchus fissidentatus]